MQEERSGEGTIRAIQRAIDILNCFSIEKRELSLTEIAKRTGLPKSTASRIIQTLVQNNFLCVDKKSGLYRLGPQLVYLIGVARDSMEIRNVARPVMVSLRDESSETVNLYVRSGTKRVCIEQVESPLPVRRSVRLGENLPLWAGASGKVLMAYMDEQGKGEVIKEALAAKPGFDVQRLLEQLEEIKQKEYAVTHGEREEGVSSVAAPIFNADGVVEAAIAISGPSVRWTEANVKRFIELVKRGAGQISRELGYSGGKKLEKTVG